MATLTSGDWITVTRRRRPKTLQSQAPPPPTKAVPIAPYLTKPTFAQMLQTLPPKPSKTVTLPALTQQSSTYQKPIRTFQLPDSPTQLRFPPSPHFQEWWGRCFRCARKGHIASECRNPTRCLCCAGEGHHTKACKQFTSYLDPAARPFQPTKLVTVHPLPLKNQEASFYELLGANEPTDEPPIMPDNRPKELTCYFNRDNEYFVNVGKLDRGIVVISTQQNEPTMDNIADLVASSRMISAAQVQVGRLRKNRFLVLLPAGFERDAVVRAIPRKVWDDGFTFHTYSPLFDASIDIPLFKIWVDLEGVPIELWRESDIAKAVSGFGMYLGSMEPAMQGNFCSWSVFVATSDLKEVPLTLRLKVGGLVFIADVKPRKWINGLVYEASDLPPMPNRFSAPPLNPSPTCSEESDDRIAIKMPRWFEEEDEIIPMRLTTLKSYFQGVDMADIPSDLAACLAGDKEVIRANKLAYKEWEAQKRSPVRQIPVMVQHTSTIQPSVSHKIRSPITATENQIDKEHSNSIGGSSQLMHKSKGKELMHNPSNSEKKSDGKGQLPLTVFEPDPLGTTMESSFLCDTTATGSVWDPNVLFPELGIATAFNSNQVIAPQKIKGQRKSRAAKQTHVTTQTPRRSSRINGKDNIINNADLAHMDPNAFVDIPLKYAEGRDLLALIGCSHIPIPPNLMQQPKSAVENMGQRVDGPQQLINVPVEQVNTIQDGPSTSRGKRKKTLACNLFIPGPFEELFEDSVQNTLPLNGVDPVLNQDSSEMVNLHLESEDEEDEDM